MTNPVTRILCYGDSNTWGYNPKTGDRYPYRIRWPGALQSLLGEGYEIIEEGLNGRTTNLDYSHRQGRNGLTYFVSCMDSHHPLDYVILNLGANDTKPEFSRSPEQISSGMEELIKVAKGQNLEDPSPGAKIILVAPSPIQVVDGPYGDALKDANKKISEFVPLYRALADQHQLIFVNLFDLIHPSHVDGVHLPEIEHQKIAKIMYETITGKRK